MRPKRDFRSVSKEIYTQFCAEHPEAKIAFKDYVAIIKEHNRSLVNYLLETGEKVMLPWGMGPLSIIKYKKEIKKIENPDGTFRYNYSINWLETKKAGKYVYHLNLHTGGFSYTWFWSPYMSHIKFAHTWGFSVWREGKRGLAAKTKDPQFKFNDIYRAHIKRKHL